MIEISHLVKKYGEHYAVDDLSFQVEKGQIYGFLGPNGAGKSTTMNILTGYLAATSGEVKINGKDIMKQPEEAKMHIGYLPELPPLYPDMTVYEYLKFVAELKKVPKAEQKKQISEIMEMTQIQDMSERLIQNLSKGYKQRVGLAQAMVGYPEVIILDEPTVGLDPKQIIEIRDLILSLKEKHTVILSSHILSEVSAVCDHILIISKGRLVASDSPEGLNKLMGGENQLELEVKGSEEALTKILSEIPQIKEYTVSKTNEDNIVQATIKTEGKEEIRENLFYKLAEKKLPLHKMVASTKTLEDIFLELTDAKNVAEVVREKKNLFKKNKKAVITENAEQVSEKVIAETDIIEDVMTETDITEENVSSPEVEENDSNL